MKRRSMYSEPSRGLLRKFGEERPRRSGDGLCAVGDGPAMCAPVHSRLFRIVRQVGAVPNGSCVKGGVKASVATNLFRVVDEIQSFSKNQKLRAPRCSSRTSTRHSRDRVYNVPPQLTHTFTSTTLIGRTLLAAPTAIVHSHAAKWLGHCHCAALPPSPPRLHVLSRRVRGALASLPHLKSVAAGPPAAAGAAGAAAAGAAGF